MSIDDMNIDTYVPEALKIPRTSEGCHPPTPVDSIPLLGFHDVVAVELRLYADEVNPERGVAAVGPIELLR